MNECIVNICRNEWIYGGNVNLCSLQTLWESILSQQWSWRSKNRVKWKDRKCEQYLNPNRSLGSYGAISYREYNFLPPFFFLLGRGGSDAQRDMQVKRHKNRGTRQPRGWCVPRENRIVKPKSVIRSWTYFIRLLSRLFTVSSKA